jgi:Fe-S-cluster containining protein
LALPRYPGFFALDTEPETVSTEPGDCVEVHPGKQVVVDFDPSLTFECVDDCTWCCHHGVLLYEPDFLQLADCASLAEATTQVRGEDFVRKEQKRRDDHTGDDGAACFFLRDDGLCSLHAEHDWKPARCSVFPLSVSVEDGDRTGHDAGDIHVSVRESAHDHCEGLNVSERRVVAHLDAFLPEVLWELDNPESRREL